MREEAILSKLGCGEKKKVKIMGRESARTKYLRRLLAYLSEDLEFMKRKFSVRTDKSAVYRKLTQNG